jgi:transposase InsO family protein
VLPAADGGGDQTHAVEAHVDVLKTFVEQQRFGSGQEPRRTLEQRVRRRALDVAERLADCGLGLDEVGQRLGVSGRTLRHWQAMYQPRDEPLTLLGRPAADSGPAQQQAVLQHLHEVGPGVGVPTLRGQFPALARAELDALLKCYRALWRAQHPRLLHVLHWQRPGTVWALDFAEAPSWIDGVCPYLLAVRDLASGQQLLWQPVLAPTAAVVSAALVPLFVAHGAPWVLKSDNGPAFRAAPTKRLLARWQVCALFSPPHTPAYNGSIEAAIGALKTRTQRLAELAGHPEHWRSAVVEAARCQANAAARPRRLHGACPAEVWAARAPLRAADRASFRATVTRLQAETWLAQGGRPDAVVSHWTQAAVDRIAIRRALVAHDLLLFRRRSIPAQIERPKAASRG